MNDQELLDAARDSAKEYTDQNFHKQVSVNYAEGYEDGYQHGYRDKESELTPTKGFDVAAKLEFILYNARYRAAFDMTAARKEELTSEIDIAQSEIIAQFAALRQQVESLKAELEEATAIKIGPI